MLVKNAKRKQHNKKKGWYHLVHPADGSLSLTFKGNARQTTEEETPFEMC